MLSLRKRGARTLTLFRAISSPRPLFTSKHERIPSRPRSPPNTRDSRSGLLAPRGAPASQSLAQQIYLPGRWRAMVAHTSARTTRAPITRIHASLPLPEHTRSSRACRSYTSSRLTPTLSGALLHRQWTSTRARARCKCPMSLVVPINGPRPLSLDPRKKLLAVL